jgi:L-alanine-DL-glutamate epimerase-like enolase superfamily enzyme
MSTYERIADLPLRVDGYELLPLARPTSSGWDRVSTVVRMHGGGHTGEGEDVWLENDDHRALVGRGPVLPLAGDWTIDTLSRRLGQEDLFPDAPSPIAHGFRRWGFEAAALDLALRQAGVSLADRLGRTPRPVTYVLSVRLAGPGERSSLAPIAERLARYPGLRFKLDPVPDWDDALIAGLLALAPGRIDSLDFKAHYSGSIVDGTPDADLYARCIAAWPEAWIEDPSLDPAVAPVLEGHWDRVTWDAPIHSLQDILDLPRPPRTVNIKPCRFGSLEALMGVYDHCDAAGIGMYGGGFFELGPGRGQIQYLASLFHPDGPNDVAPRGFHWPDPGSGIPPSPLAVAASPTGFAWDDADPPPAGGG